MRDNRFFILLASRQIGKTTMMTIYALWIACFNNDQRILIVANKEGTAIEIMNRIRLAYEELPNWLKPGVKEYGKTAVTLANGTRIGISTITCTPKHKITLCSNGTYKYASELNVGDIIYGDEVVTSIDVIQNNDKVYELLHVADNHRYYANGILSNQCLILDELAFIEPNLVDDFWKSVYPIVSASKKSKIFIASTANGTENLFYKLYSGAESGDSNWAYDKILWNEIPGRNEKWKQDTIASIGSTDAWMQEFECQFISTGESSLDLELFEKLSTQAKDPKFVFDDGHYLLWDEPKDDRIYVASVDTAEGLGRDASVIQILDYTDLTNIEQVATYHNNLISPYNFTEKVHEILQHWGNPLVCIERNNSGGQVVDILKNTHNYENIVSWGAATASSRKNNQLGIVAHTNTKYKGVMNMRYWLNELEAVKINDIHLVKELKDFTKHPNGTWSARKGKHDDRVTSMMWNLIILIDDIVTTYFDVVKYDLNNRPLELQQFDYGIKYFIDPTSMYTNEKGTGYTPTLPVIIGNAEQVNNDMGNLINQGYKLWQM